ncbi:MAG: futalosine hydrolase, partial [Stackebrandtia sp.]
ETVVAVRSVSPELGVAHDGGFKPLGELGFGSNVADCDARLTERVEARRGDVLTLSTITGHAALAERLAGDYPEALAEAMEGFGAATAAAQAGLPFAEIRAISNVVGDRDVASWDWQAGFAALTRAAKSL